MLYGEVYKICKRKLVFLMTLILFIAAFIFFKIDGGYTSPASVACKENGKIITGKEAVNYNKKIALSYNGKITDGLLEQIHNDYAKAPKADFYGSDENNSTFGYFKSFFNIDKIDYHSVKEVYPDYKGDLNYGFADCWRALYTSISRILELFPLFIIMAAPLFSYERECGMNELLAVVGNGKDILARYKVKAAFIVMNFILVSNIALILFMYFIAYGTDGYDTSIQCGNYTYFSMSVMDCSYLQLVLHTIILGIAGCNVLLSIIIFISLKVKKPVACFGISLIVTYFLSYSVLHKFTNNSVFEAILALIPVNVFDTYTLVNINSIFGMKPVIGYFIVLEIYCVIVIVFIIYSICRLFKKERYA